MCSCKPEYQGAPPNCRPECIISAECPTDKACVNQKCSDPCVGQCGQNAICHVINHSPICSCAVGFTGDSFSRCYLLTSPVEFTKPSDPCSPSPCGPFSQCRGLRGIPSCTCLSGYIGAPPQCRPECTINADCPSDTACINQKCKDPCPGSCGLNAQCFIKNHTPICTCIENYAGDAFTECKLLGNICSTHADLIFTWNKISVLKSLKLDDIKSLTQLLYNYCNLIECLPNTSNSKFNFNPVLKFMYSSSCVLFKIFFIILQKYLMMNWIHVIHLLVEQTHNVIMESVHAFPNTTEILISNAVQSAF